MEWVLYLYEAIMCFLFHLSPIQEVIPMKVKRSNLANKLFYIIKNNMFSALLNGNERLFHFYSSYPLIAS